MILFDALKEARELLIKAGVCEYEPDADILLEYVTGYDHTALILERSTEISEDMYLRYMELVKKRVEHMPVQYLTGKQQFMGLDFKVTPAVLIPRQDTECLVLEAIKYSEGKKVLDMCTGSGCIIISIMKCGKAISGTAVDVSGQALEIAAENAEMNDVNVEFIQSDMFEKVKGNYDLIVSNPPYVTEQEMEELAPEVRFHEPENALYGPDEGLAFYRILAGDGRKFLHRGGHIIMEIGCNQAAAVCGILKESGYNDINVVKDLAGHDRVVLAVYR